MDDDQARQLGDFLRQRREELGLSANKLAAKIGVRQSTVTRLEHGTFANPKPDTLEGVAEALELDPAELRARAGQLAPEQLEPRTYLRAKYRDLSPEELGALQRDVARVLKRHGIDPTDGPAPGEDERPTTTRRTTPTTKGGTP